MYFDTHAHYDDAAFDADRNALLESMPERGVSLIVNPGCSLASSRTAVALARRYPFLRAAVGVHPHDAAGMKDGDVDALRALAREEPVVAIGEIGLDYYYDRSPRQVQKERFREQMALAQSLGLPVILHDREAHEDCLRIVREFRNVRGVCHCYSGSLEQAKILVRLGWSISFTGAITYRNARRALEVVSWIPADRLMLETDCPYLTPVPHRGKRNDSGFLPLIAQTAAEIRGVSVEELAALTLENGKRFFGIT